MSMTMFLHKYTGDNRCLNKWTYADPPATGDSKKSIDVYQLTSILAPQVTLDYDSSVLSSGYNYCYIKEWGRYYYITDISCDSGKKIILTLAVDALNTWRDGIKNSPVTVIRSESVGINYVPDKQLPIDPTRFTLKIPIDAYHIPFPAETNTSKHYAVMINAST